MQVRSKEFYEDLHDIYDLVTLDDEDVIQNKPHFPEEEVATVASDDLLPMLAALSVEDVVDEKKEDTPLASPVVVVEPAPIEF
jgi:hypothetical protein